MQAGSQDQYYLPSGLFWEYRLAFGLVLKEDYLVSLRVDAAFAKPQAYEDRDVTIGIDISPHPGHN